MGFHPRGSGFVSSVALTNRSSLAGSSSICHNTTSTVSIIHHVRRSPSIRTAPKMEVAPAKKKDKKRAAPTFATDIKGNIAWTLRSAMPDDVDAIYPLVEDRLPQDMVELFISDSPCCMVCEASIKGSKEGQGYYPVIMGVVLTDITNYLSDETENLPVEKLKKDGHLVTIIVDPDFPDADAPKKLLLGALKKMKEYNVYQVTHVNDDAERIELITQCLFKANGKNELDMQSFIVDLKKVNPDPKKKIS